MNGIAPCARDIFYCQECRQCREGFIDGRMTGTFFGGLYYATTRRATANNIAGMFLFSFSCSIHLRKSLMHRQRSSLSNDSKYIDMRLTKFIEFTGVRGPLDKDGHSDQGYPR